MIQKNLIIILGTEPRILCSEVIRKNNSSMTQLTAQPGILRWYPCKKPLQVTSKVVTKYSFLNSNKQTTLHNLAALKADGVDLLKELLKNRPEEVKIKIQSVFFTH